MIGCDISKLDKFTLNLLTNDEVITINQDSLGKQAQQIIKNDSCQVWVKELSDGSRAIGIFNMSNEYKNLHVSWKDLGLSNVQQARDLWRQKNIGRIEKIYEAAIPPHGVRLLKIK